MMSSAYGMASRPMCPADAGHMADGKPRLVISDETLASSFSEPTLNLFLRKIGIAFSHIAPSCWLLAGAIIGRKNMLFK